MKDVEIIEALRAKLTMPGGRHLYGVLSTYKGLSAFGKRLTEVRDLGGANFPAPKSVNKGILDSIPDDDFRRLAEDEAKRPEPTTAHVERAFKQFLRSQLLGFEGLLVLSNFEMLFAYRIELDLLRTMAADENRILMLLPGKRTSGRIVMFPNHSQATYALPSNLIAENHLWELTPTHD